MAFFVWSEGFSVGVQEMDDQHKVLIDMINAIHSNRDASVAADILQKMVDYTELHFRREETLLRGILYRELGMQLREHKAFLDKTREFATQDTAAPLLHDQLAAYLRNWLSHHILEVDMKYKQAFLKSGG